VLIVTTCICILLRYNIIVLAANRNNKKNVTSHANKQQRGAESSNMRHHLPFELVHYPVGGVWTEVVDAVHALDSDDYDPARRWMTFRFLDDIDRPDTVYIVSRLEALLLEEEVQHQAGAAAGTSNNNNNNNNTQCWRTGLNLDHRCFSREAIPVLCAFFCADYALDGSRFALPQWANIALLAQQHIHQVSFSNWI
jgi:hypothetical protein